MNSTGNPIADAVLVFQRYQVKNVLIGGAAIMLHGSSYVTLNVETSVHLDSETSTLLEMEQGRLSRSKTILQRLR